MKKIIKKYRFILCAIIGILIGLIFKEKAIVLKPLGTLFVNMIFVCIVPLVFLSITSNITKTDNNKSLKNILSKFLTVIFSTLVITGVFTIISATIVNPYGNSNIKLETSEIEKINLSEKMVDMLTVADFSELFNKSNVLPLIIFSIFIGISINLLKDKNKISSVLNTGHEIINKYLKIVMYYAPIGITAYLASLVGEYGSMFIAEYLKIIIMYLILGLINIFVFHTLYLFIAGGKTLVKKYYKNIIQLVVTAVSTQSSVVTMPTNIKVLNEMEISDEVVGICTPISTLINMQGNVIQNILKIFLLYSLFSLNINGISDYIFFIIISIFAGMITAGIPGGGVISNTILVSSLQLPSSALSILVTIEWLLDAPATAFNILSDTATIPLIDKYVKKRKNDNKRKKIQK